MQRDGDVEPLGAAHERSLPLHERRLGGVFYTPPAVAEQLVEATLGRVLAGGTEEVRVVDPACGGGALLVAAYRRLLAWHAARGRVTAGMRRRILERSICGVDVDAEAVEVTRRVLAQVADVDVAVESRVRVADGLFDEGLGAFDVVLANPPYLGAEVMTRHQPGLRARCQGRFAAARGNWDLFCVFIERCLGLTAAGGRCGMIVPNKLLSAGYAEVVRGLLVGGEVALESLRIFEGAVFAADVYPIAFVAARAARGAEVVCERVIGEEVVARERLAWSLLTDGPWVVCGGDEARVVARVRAAGRPLGELAAVRGAATVAEAYAMAGLIREGEHGLKVVNSGTIDPYEHLWGRRRLRYLGASYLRPVIPDELSNGLPAKRLADARTPKVIVSGMTRTLEAVLDRDGTLMAGKSTTIVSAQGVDPAVIAALLNSEVVGWYHRRVFGGDRLAGGYLRVGPPQLRQLPVVFPRGSRLVELVRGMPDPAIRREIDAVVAAAYGLTAEDVATIEVRSRSMATSGERGTVEASL